MLKGGLLTMIKKQQKWIALLVTLTFVWLLQVSVMPLNAANAPEQISSVNNEQGPHFIEEEGDSGYQTRKKSILPIILIGVGVVAVAAVLFLVVLKTKYEITGTWSLTYGYSGGSFTYDAVFSGTKASGTLVMNGTVNGVYTVDGKNVSCYVANTHQKWEFIGAFTSKTHMEGEFKYYWDNVLYPEWGGTFSADKK
jgi:hypothetical protein